MTASFENKNVVVLGYGRSGRSAVSALVSLGAVVTLTTNEIIADEKVRQTMKGWGVEIVDGHHPTSLLNDAELIVKNPGIPYSIPFLESAADRDVPIITEVELAYHMSDAPIIGITGTNGKTTVTHLIGEMLERSGLSPILCGNIGYPASEAVREAAKEDILVMELSSFQLMGIKEFRPDTAVFTNIYEAHIDYHGTREAYVQAKMNLLSNMDQQQTVIFNGAQREMLHDPASLHVEYFSTTDGGEASIEDGMVTYKGMPLIHIDQVKLKGDHNLENILAALLAAKRHGATDEAVRETLLHFGSIPHRMEHLGEYAGASYYNDSKATNNLATTFALKSFKDPIIWIAGGLDRGQSLESLAPHMDNVRMVITFGETKDKFKALAESTGKTVLITEHPHDAVQVAAKHAEVGDVVLFSPACASWDQYKDYEARGDHFKEGFSTLDR
ncbi:UDP-N-acetylmuramoyl-L-alanine--D-glutamate ligase [Salinicoccus sp. ID82-1]|uniref:UDP-N-acetylmuramoylalanine--D-glutamate ligase n=1 Tax=Salinicoccus cyprini TaxID=2493691 RepID=A0A558AXY6_9STAP|nr:MULTISPECIES: UDP-N-acetylmuramoyl-L-alanine--D-glutamate ligase [Salinicoccus]MCG1008639.1 UDP-N-acetylmuramoyl-L-alanine--D-glutamate ligase [Salinicoccus sp. ID82-1]TVT29117.1 UDP-N-acetylmuramoyl-L-alanine--D-glutamate ligase [Salinicoccus cyprini]